MVLTGAHDHTARAGSETAARPAGGVPSVRGFRPEVEGLRAFAVVLVVLDHVFSRPSGGFIGVDVFFVISGFLISSLLIREFDRTGKISIVAFYRRRARRILPAALAVLAVTALLSKLLFFASRAHDTFVDILWALCFAANIHFARIGTDYFQADRQPSPVQHFWSLAVEEQFYVVWPLALFLLLFAARAIRNARVRRVLLTVVTVAIAVALLVWAVRLTHSDRTSAYFATQARAWELGIGAALAVGLSGVRRMNRWLAASSIGIGTVGVVVAAFVTSPDRGFPAPAALVATLAAGLVIFGGTGLEADTRLSRVAWPLTNPVSRYVGRVSYSLYLWHWPAIIFVETQVPKSSTYYWLASLLAMAGATVFSYRYVETPFREHGLAALTFWRRPGRSGLFMDYWAGADRRESARVAVASIALIVVAFAVIEAKPPEPLKSFQVAVPATVQTGDETVKPSGQVTPPPGLASQIVDALGMTSFPALTPSLSHLADAKVPEWDECANVDASTLANCTFPASTTTSKTAKSVAVIGDSLGITWLPAIRTLQKDGYTVYGLTYGQCPAVDVSVNQEVGGDPTFFQRCDAHRDWAVQEVAKLKPDIVVLADSLETISRLHDGSKGQAAFAEWQHGVSSISSRLAAVGAKHIDLISPPPPGPSLQQCAVAAGSTPADCVSQVSQNWFGVTGAERTAAKQAGLHYIDVELLFCSSTGLCPSFIGTTPVRVDGNHLTGAYSAQLGPIIAPLLVK